MQGFDLDTVLLSFGAQSDSWTIRNAVEGVQIFGGIGSGKTSGSGRMLALKYLRAGFGGLILTVKADEKELWQQYCQQTGRLDDLMILAPGGEHFFNFLEYESRRVDKGSSITENIVHVMKTVISAGETQSGGRTDDPFWETALDMLIFNVVDLCKLAYGRLELRDLYEVVQSIPKSVPEFLSQKKSDNKFLTAFELARDFVRRRIDEWESTQDTDDIKNWDDNGIYSSILEEQVPEARMFSHLDQFFVGSFISLNDRTRSIIEYSFSGFLFRLLRDPVYTLFCSKESTLVPDDCLNGKIILVDLPVKIYDKAGRDCQILFKYIWQRAMERRNLSYGDRPVFLWADEAQNFLHEHDSDYQATARASRICTVYISQNLPNYYANMNGRNSDHRVMGFLGTLSTKIFHANADVQTNGYASSLIGDGPIEDTSKTNQFGINSMSKSETTSIKFEPRVRPEKFTKLLTGGPQNNFKVEGYMHRQSASRESSENYFKMSFSQNYKP